MWVGDLPVAAARSLRGRQSGKLRDCALWTTGKRFGAMGKAQTVMPLARTPRRCELRGGCRP
jgi:hypothetical protein